MKLFSATRRLCAIPFQAFCAIFAKLAAMPDKPRPAAPPRPSMPPACPFCGGQGAAIVAIVEACDCGCGQSFVRGGPGRACAVCSGTCTVTAAAIRAQAAAKWWIAPLQDYARAGKWN